MRPRSLADCQERIARFLSAHKYAFLIYHPGLSAPSHLDGHHHHHLCANLLIDGVIPAGAKLQRNFHFWPEERGLANRTCRRLVDRNLARRYRLTDFFFALSQCLGGDRMARVAELARTGTVEVMTHPVNPIEREYLMGDRYLAVLQGVERGTH